ncbi:MAG: serine/threonine protein kinase [Acaryochloridaceae cyanobacterium SU_2_1]|nr:serine/threonine protein kinase [Acaryochloridaceae cyanobacterium SU_2_1]
MAKMSDKVIAYRYHVLDTLAKGAFGTTYLAQDTYLSESSKCVIKQLKPDSNDPAFLKIARRLFEQEARILGSLGNHPRIPNLLSYFESDQDFFLVQEFIDGTSISKELSHDKRWPQSKVQAFLEECLKILQFVHGLGVIHRDIKPDNLIRRLPDQAVFLLDFGAVKEISRNQGKTQLVETTIAVGTPGYMPDEQIRGKPHFSSDIYALGAIGIYGLTGIRPITFERSLEDEIIWEDHAEVNPVLAEILSKMVQRDYRKRYQSAADVLADLAKLTLQSAPEIAGTDTQVQISQAKVAAPAISDPAVAVSVKNDSQGTKPELATIFQVQDSWPDPSAAALKKTDVQTAVQLEQETLRVPADGAEHQPRWRRTALRLLLPTTILLGAGAGVFFLLERPNELGRMTAELNQLYGQQKYSECINKGESALASLTSSRQQLLNPLSKCYLEQANQMAAQKKFGDAVQMVAKVSDQSTYHFQAQEKLSDWSTRLLQNARRDYEVNGNLKQAMASVEHIPQSSLIKPQATLEAKKWQDKHNANQKKIDTAKKALKEGRAEDAIATTKQIKAPEYWKKVADQVQKEAEVAIANRPAPQPEWQPPSQTAAAPTWSSTPDSPVYEPAPAYQQPAPAYQPPAYQQPAPAYQPPPPPQKEVVNVCPGPLCTQ